MANILNLMPDLEPDEMAYVQSLVQDMPQAEAQQFANIYRARRKEPKLVLITAIIGFFGVAGVHRFLLGQIGMGLLYFFTGGLCLVGTIIDMINHKRLAFEYNVKEAQQALAMMRGYGT
ncbi:TM2 domain-containing protein [Pontibacter chitinilyticus]|uniref:TM2 domain-containing protein n=1 Tax=Pontibacter chitinilyticus TaxID=2674989 RepID=UPI00321A8941